MSWFLTFHEQEARRHLCHEFAARIWNIEHQVTERLAKAAEHNKMTMDARARHMAGLAVGKKAWLSSSGITMPWDRHRPSQKLKARYYGPFKILEQTAPRPFNAIRHSVMQSAMRKSRPAGTFRVWYLTSTGGTQLY